MRRITNIIALLLAFASCHKKDILTTPVNEKETFISAVDISSYPEIANSNPLFYDLLGNQKDFLLILKENGINTIRLKLWVNPTNEHAGFNEVKQFSQALKSQGFKIWLTVHYSDTWADPGNQHTPALWQNLDFSALKDSVYYYTKKVTTQINPDFIQIGNEINAGILHPQGNISSNLQNFIDLIKMGCLAVRQSSMNTKIMLHFAGIEASDWFFDQVRDVDYDVIGLSYYPILHGKSLPALKTKMQQLSTAHKKKIIIAETAYPFTLTWNDWTHNVVGQNDQLILPDFPANADGQKDFIHQIRKITKEVENGIGFCYWGAELIAWRGNQSTNGSPWENQALFDFNNKVLPVITEFKND